MDHLTPEEVARSQQPDYPPEKSMGGTNAYSVHCEIVGWRPGYCICLHKIAAVERDGSVPGFESCEKAILNKTCPSLAMREEERKAGKALHYVDRDLLQAEMQRRYKVQLSALQPARPAPKPRFNQAPLTSTKPAPAPAPATAKISSVAKPEIDLMSGTGDYADAINAAIKESTPVEKKAPSLMDLARQQFNKTQPQE